MNETQVTDLKYREPDLAKGFTHPLARELREARASITYRWLERIEERVEVGEDQVFPSNELLDHVPLLISAVADFIENPAEEGTASDEVMAKAAELGEMRFRQGFSTYQVLVEFEVLGGIILALLRSRVTELGFTPSPDDVVVVVHRVYRALSKVLQATAARHISLLEEQRRDLDQRLRVTHGMLGALIQGPLPAAVAGGTGSDEARALEATLRDLSELTESGTSSRRQGVPLSGAVREAVRRIRPMAQEADLDIHVLDPLPRVDVPDAPVEQCLVVFLTNALRHCKQEEGECRVEVGGRLDEEQGEVVVFVRNTGHVVEATRDITELAPGPEERDVVVPERGVGLRLARDLIRSIGGRTWAEPSSDPAGSVFAMALPSRRSDDARGS